MSFRGDAVQDSSGTVVHAMGEGLKAAKIIDKLPVLFSRSLVFKADEARCQTCSSAGNESGQRRKSKSKVYQTEISQSRIDDLNKATFRNHRAILHRALA